MSVCRGCGREIRWIKTKAGKAMPVDEPFVHFVPAGGPDTFITGDGSTVRGHRPTGKEIHDRIATQIGYTPHWATCPVAGHFRARSGAAAAPARRDGCGAAQEFA